MTSDETRSHFPRLDVLDSILEPCVDPDFIAFVERHPEARIALVVLGAVECGVTLPRHWIDMRQRLEEAGRRYIEMYIDEQLTREID